MVEKGFGNKRQKLDFEPGSANVVRSLDACRRCRTKKVKCDQNFPTCLRCQKAGSECVGIDRATGKAIPRSYVYYLEQRISSLENILTAHGIETKANPTIQLPIGLSQSSSISSNIVQSTEDSKREPLAGNAHAAESPTYMGASLGITFAKLITAAVKMKKETLNIQIDQLKNLPPVDQIPAVLPAKNIAQIFVSTYFAHSNSQLPILHREMFLNDFFEPIYGSWDDSISPTTEPFSKIKRSSTIAPEDTWIYKFKQMISNNLSDEHKSTSRTILQPYPEDVPEQYHRPLFYLNLIFAIASSVNHLQYMNSISEQFRTAALGFLKSAYCTSDPLEQLQANLILSLYSLMRPCKPGIWHILGKCLRICVELGLHNNAIDKSAGLDAFTKDRRRRLFWCTYSLDRQICFYMGRPVGIPEGSIKTLFPSELDDAYILENSPGVKDYSKEFGGMPSYKSISISFFRIRKIQLEVQRVLYEGEEIPRRFANLDDWKYYVQAQLDEWWQDACNLQNCSGTKFHIEFFSLNYNHTLLLLNGLSPRNFKLSQEALIKVAQTSKNLMSCYSQLYNKKAINYTWAAVHNLSMAGTSFLYALYHSDEARELFPKEIVMKVSEDCIIVLSLLIASCDAARDCLQMFRILTVAILKIRYNEVVGGSTLKKDDSRIPHVPNPQNSSEPKDEAKSEFVDQLRVSNLINPKEDANCFVPNADSEFAFNWVSHNTSDDTAENPTVLIQNGDIGLHDSNFDIFLAEAADQSPATSLQDTAEDSLSEYALDMENASSDLFPIVKDGRKAYDLIQLPTEFIWDQFFTEPKLN